MDRGAWQATVHEIAKLDTTEPLSMQIISFYVLFKVCACMPAGLSPQSSPALCDPVDCSPPGSSIQGILQARKLEWVAIPFSRGSSPPRDRTCISYVLYHFHHLGSLLFKEILFKYKNLKIYTSGFVLF